MRGGRSSAGGLCAAGGLCVAGGLCALAALICAMGSWPVRAADGTAAEGTDTSASGAGAADLEEVSVYASHTGAASAGQQTVSQEDMRRFDRNTLDEAILLAAGTSVSLVGARNETDVWIRGFDRWRVPLYQDGIPVYLPYDDRIDFSRFSTIDVAAIQVEKGFASVIDGPGAMGGAINLVSRIAQKPLEGEARYEGTFDSDGQYDGTLADGFVGSRQGNWFAQAAGSFDRQTHFRLSDDFVPGTLQGSGDRIDSYHEDYKINLKAGYASAGTEYSVNFIDQIGKKDNAPPDDLIPSQFLNQVKYWTWPAWNMRSIYLLAKQVIDADGSFIKAQLYDERFFNQLDSFDSIAYDTQNTPKSFDSTYLDYAAGGGVELDENLAGGADTVRVAGHFRWDQHNESESTRNAPFAPLYDEPWETAQETTTSAAVENIFRPGPAWQIIAGASYDFRHLIGDSEWVAQGTTPPFGYSYAYPVADKRAWNGELALDYAYSDTGSLRLTYADRARFPTLFEMYSTRFGAFVNNPELEPERSHYAQLGVTDTIAGTHVSADVFIARVSDAIEAVALSPQTSEDENVGTERQTGYEIELSRELASTLDGGAQFSQLHREQLSGAVVPVDTPDQRLFAWLDWHPLPAVSLVPSVDLTGQRWLQNAVNATVYYRAGSFALLGVKAAYRASDGLSLEAGVRNLTDRNYVIEDGYNGPGRQYFAGLRATL